MKRMENWYKQANTKFEMRINSPIDEALILLGCICVAILMFIRVFYGTEITDEAYYISDAIQMMRGNLPYAYNNFSFGTGSAFLIIPFVYLYSLIVPNNEGIFLYTRICYLLFWFACIYLGYRVLKKDFKRKNALLISGFLIPYVAGVGIINFSYNTIPNDLVYVCSLTIYDAIAHRNQWSKGKLFLSGFVLGIALFAHPGYGIAIGMLGLLVLIQSHGAKDKIINILCCLAGGILEILVVFIPVILQTGIDTLYAGIYRMFHGYPTSPMSTTAVNTKVLDLVQIFAPRIIVLIILFILMFLFSKRFIREENKKLDNKELLHLSLATAFFALILRDTINNIGNSWMYWMLGIDAAIAVAAALFLRLWKNHLSFGFFAVYPIAFSLAQIIKVDSSASFSRFTAAIPAVIFVLLFLLESKSKYTRGVAACCIGIYIFAMGFTDFSYVYRDEPVRNLNDKVESGIYKGIYTTTDRSKDLVELEKYLNSIVGKEELYAFRDNVPAAYLMMHNGIMIDKATWDCLNYSYQKNAPATLYNYYQRREKLPQKYIYIDYGRDEKLSIEDEDFKFNEFINTYYDQTADFKLNETFFHVMVYEYQGEFDGNFDYWIERHMYRAEDKEK